MIPQPMSDDLTPTARLHWPVLEDGMLTGLLGAGLVAAWFLVLDTVRGASFFTPTLLGSVIFDQTPAAQVADVSVQMVFAYSGLHVIAFLIVGMGMAWMFREFNLHPQFGLVYLLLFIMFEAIIFGLEVAMAPDILGVIGTWAVAAGNALSAAGMFWFLSLRYPHSMRRLLAGWND